MNPQRDFDSDTMGTRLRDLWASKTAVANADRATAKQNTPDAESRLKAKRVLFGSSLMALLDLEPSLDAPWLDAGAIVLAGNRLNGLLDSNYPRTPKEQQEQEEWSARATALLDENARISRQTGKQETPIKTLDHVQLFEVRTRTFAAAAQVQTVTWALLAHARREEIRRSKKKCALKTQNKQSQAADQVGTADHRDARKAGNVSGTPARLVVAAAAAARDDKGCRRKKHRDGGVNSPAPKVAAVAAAAAAAGGDGDGDGDGNRDGSAAAAASSTCGTAPRQRNQATEQRKRTAEMLAEEAKQAEARAEVLRRRNNPEAKVEREAAAKAAAAAAAPRENRVDDPRPGLVV